jgi:hypothetical protein
MNFLKCNDWQIAIQEGLSNKVLLQVTLNIDNQVQEVRINQAQDKIRDKVLHQGIQLIDHLDKVCHLKDILTHNNKDLREDKEPQQITYLETLTH